MKNTGHTSPEKSQSAATKPKPLSESGNFPARLHVLLAREAKVGLVIRRGPSKSVCTVLWNRERDTFKLGQWMRGRIYERRCDLFPNGVRFISLPLCNFTERKATQRC